MATLAHCHTEMEAKDAVSQREKQKQLLGEESEEYKLLSWPP